MSEDPASERIAVVWSAETRTDLRAIDREPAMQILYCVDRFLATRTGGRPGSFGSVEGRAVSYVPP